MTRARIDLVARRGWPRSHPDCPDRKVQRSVDRALYRQRNFIERFFNELRHFRRIATRYDKTARNFLAAILLAASRLWIQGLSPRPSRLCVTLSESFVRAFVCAKVGAAISSAHYLQ